jgi:hypothetical protein
MTPGRAIVLAIALAACLGALTTRQAPDAAGQPAAAPRQDTPEPTEHPELPDLTITDLAVGSENSPTCAPGAPPVGLHVAVSNLGPESSGPFIVEANGAVRRAHAGLPAGETGRVWLPGYVVGENAAVVDVVDQVWEADETNNEYRSSPAIPTVQPLPTCRPGPDPSPTPTPQPDLRPLGMSIALPPNWQCGDDPSLGVYLQVENIGPLFSGPFIASANDAQLAHEGLPPIRGATMWFPGAAGTGQVRAEVDVGQQVAESREDNNVREQMLPVPTLPPCPDITPTPTPDGPLPDLVPVGLYFQHSGFNGFCIPPGAGIDMRPCVANRGDAAAGPFDVVVGPSSTRWRVEGGLPAGEQRCLAWRPSQRFDELVVDPEDEVVESDETNNRIQPPTPPPFTAPPPCTPPPTPPPAPALLPCLNCPAVVTPEP